MRRTWPLALALVLAGCSDSTGPEALDVEAEIRQLTALSQEASRQGDWERASALGTAVAAIRAGGTLSKITVSQGGVASEYTGIVLELQAPVQSVPPDLQFPAIRSLIAWSGSGAKQLLQVTAFGDSVDFDLFATAESPPPGPGEVVDVYPLNFGIASLRQRGTRDALWAAGGFAVLRRTSLDGPCPSAPAGTAACDRASFTVRFKAQMTSLPMFSVLPAELPPVVTVEAETQEARGARIEPTCPPRGCFLPTAPLFPLLP
jgi:hypothetical protein